MRIAGSLQSTVSTLLRSSRTPGTAAWRATVSLWWFSEDPLGSAVCWAAGSSCWSAVGSSTLTAVELSWSLVRLEAGESGPSVRTGSGSGEGSSTARRWHPHMRPIWAKRLDIPQIKHGHFIYILNSEYIRSHGVDHCLLRPLDPLDSFSLRSVCFLFESAVLLQEMRIKTTETTMTQKKWRFERLAQSITALIESHQKLVKIPRCIADCRSIEHTQLLSLLFETIFKECFAHFEHPNLGNHSVCAFGDWVFWLVFGDSRGRSCRSFLLSCRAVAGCSKTVSLKHASCFTWQITLLNWSLQKSRRLAGCT